ncbi:DUF6197 family protein [Streptomyces sp. NPDC003832]
MKTTLPAAASPPRPVDAKPLTFDERLQLAALAIDARIDTTPLDLADVIRIPEAAPLPLTPTLAPAACPYSTPIAATLWRARWRIETDGWCRTALFDDQGAICPIRAIRLEADSRHQADDACVLLLEAIERDFGDETIPSWNARQTSPAPVLLYLGRAAELAHAKGR